MVFSLGGVSDAARAVPVRCLYRVVLQAFLANLEATASSWKPKKVDNTHARFFVSVVPCPL